MIEFYVKDHRNDVMSTLAQLPKDQFRCRDEIIALLRGNTSGRYKVYLQLKRKFFSRRLYEYGIVRDNTGNIVYETTRLVNEKKNGRPDPKSDL
ncbi:hypothetical protein [Pseudomonas phage D6]|nr:hypothetical protein [Pseudomonas phage D6]